MKNKNGNILIYTLIVINLALILVYIVSSRTNSFLYSVLNENTEKIMNSNIKKKSDISLKYDYLYNLNGTGFTDTRNCPTNIIFSGTTSSLLFSLTGTTLYLDDNNKLICSGSTNSGVLNIFYSDNFLSFSGLTYSGITSSLISDGVNTSYGGLTYSGNLYFTIIPDFDNTYISFSGNIGPAGVDSNINSDNYKCNSTGSINYPGNICDDDLYARQNTFGYIENTPGYSNIFWNNSRIADYISSNSNNSDSGVSLLGSTSTGFLFLNTSDSASLKLITFDKTTFDKTNELKKVGVYDGLLVGSSSGFISFSGTGLVLYSTLNNGIVFDFKNNYYSLFLSYSGATSGTNLQYVLTGIDYNNKPLIINPVDDSNSNYFKFLGYDIIIGDTNKYYYKMTDIEAPKNEDIIKNNFVN